MTLRWLWPRRCNPQEEPPKAPSVVPSITPTPTDTTWHGLCRKNVGRRREALQPRCDKGIGRNGQGSNGPSNGFHCRVFSDHKRSKRGMIQGDCPTLACAHNQNLVQGYYSRTQSPDGSQKVLCGSSSWHHLNRKKRKTKTPRLC